jgi:hypothetical protein
MALAIGVTGAIALIVVGFVVMIYRPHNFLTPIIWCPAESLKHVIWNLGILRPANYLLTYLFVMLAFWSIVITCSAFGFMKWRNRNLS